MDEYANNANEISLTNRFINVFVQGLNLAKNRPTSLIWTEYTNVIKLSIFRCCCLVLQDC